MQLTFRHLRITNVKRCVDSFKHHLDMWSLAEWGNATAGEVGEACNIAKKLLRWRDGMQHLNTKPDEQTKHDLKQKLARELADAVIYIDLWAAAAGIDLGQAVQDKFNTDSIKHNVGDRL